MFLSKLKNELSHFKKLTQESQRLLLSFMFFFVASPILGIFVNAYLWRHTSSLNVVTIYNLAIAMGLILGFYLNGLLLGKIRINNLYLFGCVLQGVIVFILVFFSISNILSIILYGFINGIGMAFFWANRHFLTLNNTTREERFYFNNLESSLSTVIAILVPFVVGWFIVLGESLALYTASQAYITMSFIAMFLLSVCGYIIKDIKIDVPAIKNVALQNKSPKWNLYRLTTFLRGVSDGIVKFVPTLIILILLGKEGILGTVQSFTAFLSAMVMYYIGRKVGVKNRFHVILFGVTILIVGTTIFGIFYGSLAAIIYVSLDTLAAPLNYTPYQNLGFETIEDEEKIHHHHKYSYIFDQELHLNLGRMFGIIIFLVLINYLSQQTALRYTPLLVALIQIPLLFIFKKIENKNY